MSILIAAAAPNLIQLIIGFLVIVIVIAVIAGLIYAIETWIIKAPLPGMIRLVIGLILILLVIIWGLQQFHIGGI
jgi:uncharacterized protein YacL